MADDSAEFEVLEAFGDGDAFNADAESVHSVDVVEQQIVNVDDNDGAGAVDPVAARCLKILAGTTQLKKRGKQGARAVCIDLRCFPNNTNSFYASVPLLGKIALVLAAIDDTKFYDSINKIQNSDQRYILEALLYNELTPKRKYFDT
jgi:hypothetical protein